METLITYKIINLFIRDCLKNKSNPNKTLFGEMDMRHLKHITLIKILIIFIALIFSSNVYSEQDLNSDEVKALISDKTAIQKHAHKGVKLAIYFSSDGTFRHKKKGKKVKGEWHVDSEGKLCKKYKDVHEKCVAIVKAGNEWKLYFVPIHPTFPREHLFTYIKILDGNPKNL